jgi:hypothetical protein
MDRGLGRPGAGWGSGIGRSPPRQHEAGNCPPVAVTRSRDCDGRPGDSEAQEPDLTQEPDRTGPLDPAEPAVSRPGLTGRHRQDSHRHGNPARRRRALTWQPVPQAVTRISAGPALSRLGGASATPKSPSHGLSPAEIMDRLGVVDRPPGPAAAAGTPGRRPRDGPGL